MISTTQSRLVLLGIVILCLIASAIKPYSYGTWFLEVFPVLIATPENTSATASHKILFIYNPLDCLVNAQYTRQLKQTESLSFSAWIRCPNPEQILHKVTADEKFSRLYGSA